MKQPLRYICTILLEKLKAIGLSGDLLSWLDDYMSARKQFVQLSEYQSEPKTIAYGVPQGSILGPKLFSIFVNDLPESITSGNVFMFADDTTIYTIGKDFDNIILTLQCILDQVYTWCQSNRLIAHESKTEALIISSQNFIGPLPRLTYGNSTIEYKQSSKCLWLTIDSKLSWQEHIKNVCKSFSNKVAVLKRIKFLPKPVLETIYYKTIIPSVLYGIAIWGSCSSALLDAIDRIHLRGTRIINNLPQYIHSDHITNARHWNPILSFYIKRLLVITYNIYYGNSIEPLNNLLVKPKTTYNFRKSFNVEVDRPRTEVGRSSFKHRAALSWNLLPDDIKTCSNLDSIKKKLKANKNLLKSISFTKASCCISNKSLDFKYF